MSWTENMRFATEKITQEIMNGKQFPMKVRQLTQWRRLYFKSKIIANQLWISDVILLFGIV